MYALCVLCVLCGFAISFFRQEGVAIKWQYHSFKFLSRLLILLPYRLILILGGWLGFIIEDTIREYPDEWIWFLKRWRTEYVKPGERVGEQHE